MDAKKRPTSDIERVKWKVILYISEVEPACREAGSSKSIISLRNASILDRDERVWFAFSDRGVRDTREDGFCAEFGEIVRSYVAKCYLETRCERGNDFGDGTFVIYDRFHAFRHRFATMRKVALRAGCAFDNRLRSHAPIFFVFVTIAFNHVAGRFVGASEHVAAHHGRSSGCKRLCNVSRSADTTIGNDRHALFERDGGYVEHSGELRQTYARYKACCANRAGADTYLHRIGKFTSFLCGLRSGDIAENEFRRVQFRFNLFRRFDHLEIVTMCAINHDRIHPCPVERLRTIHRKWAACRSYSNSYALLLLYHHHLLFYRAVAVQNAKTP